MIPFNYCAICHAPPLTAQQYCKDHHYYDSPVYCTNCGIVLNRLLHEPKQDSTRILCSGCYHAFHYPTQTIKHNEKTLPFLHHQLHTFQPLPIHVKQAYERQYRFLASPQ